MTWFDDRHEITCPFCDAKHDVDDWYPGDEDSTEVECDCGKTFTVVASIHYTFETFCGPEKKCECEFEVYDYDGKGEKTTTFSNGETLVYARCIHCEDTKYVKREEITIK
jgi:hypothetical protein